MELKTVYSTHVSKLGYDAGTQELEVEFKNGKTAVYQGVPSNIAQMVVDAPSVGSAIHQFLKGKYAFGYKPDRPNT